MSQYHLSFLPLKCAQVLPERKKGSCTWPRLPFSMSTSCLKCTSQPFALILSACKLHPNSLCCSEVIVAPFPGRTQPSLPGSHMNRFITPPLSSSHCFSSGPHGCQVPVHSSSLPSHPLAPCLPAPPGAEPWVP